MAKSKKADDAYNFINRWANKLNLNYMGLVIGTLFYVLSLTPSLMPRGWFLQAFVAGVSFAVGYGFGVFISWSFRGLFQYEFPADVKKHAWNLLLMIGLILLVVFLILYSGWQDELRAIGDFEPLSRNQIFLMFIVSVLLALAFVGIGKLIKRLFDFLRLKMDKHVPARVSLVVGLGLTILLTVWIFNGFIFGGFIAIADNIYENKNNSDPEGYEVPPWPEHSGSSESLIPWETLGYQGKKFTASTSTIEEMTEFSGEPAMQTIRIYSGVESAETPKERAQLVIDEIRRTNAMDREVLLVVTPTGTGWIEPNSIRAIEHMYNGDIATVAQQYSYLPSWISTLVDKDRASEAGVALFEAVYEEWASVPEAERPELIVHGLSLGSFGMQSAFISPGDIVARTDGALFLGTPNFSQPWRNITDDRDEGSKEIRPVVDNYKYAVFGADKEDILDNDSKSEEPRVLFQQHASDGVVWWHPDLILHEPDWIKEEPGKDVIDDIFWIPVVTFFQVSVDQAVAGGAPDGHGHNYRDTLVYAWASVVAPEGWTDEMSDDLQSKIFQVEATGGSNN